MKKVFLQTKLLLRESWSILKSEKKLLLIPVIPIVFAMSSVGIGLYLIASVLMAGDLEKLSFSPIIFSVVILLFAFILGTFFNIVLFSCVNDRLKGEKVSVKKGFLSAMKNFGKIIKWGVMNTGVHTASSAVPVDGVSGVVAEAGRGAWKMTTIFVVPVMIFEDAGAIKAISRSVYLFTKTWGTAVVGRFSLGLIFLIKALIALGIGFGLTYLYIEFLPFETDVPIGVLWGLLIAYIIISGMLISLLGGIFNVVLYHYASTGKMPSGFSEKIIKNAYSS